VFLVLVDGMSVVCFANIGGMFPDMGHVLCNTLGIHGIQCLYGKLDISEKRVAAGAGKVLSNDDSHQFQVVGLRCHGVGGDYPTSFSELMGNRKLLWDILALHSGIGRRGIYLVIFLAGLGIQAESYKRQSMAFTLGHDYETHFLKD
jgi:hypothetical protein